MQEKKKEFEPGAKAARKKRRTEDEEDLYKRFLSDRVKETLQKKNF